VVQVFDPVWVENIKRRYERLPPYDRPVIYPIAVDEKREGLRTEIESWVEPLPVATRRKLIPRLRSSEHIQQTYNELAVGHTLRQLGYELEYERSIDGLTPDWFVHPRDEVPTFVVEAFTSNPPQDRVANSNKLNRLLGRLQQIPVGVVLRIRTNKVSEIPDQLESKRIKKGVEQWLMAGTPAVGNRMKFGGFTFEVVHKSADYQHVLCIGPVDLRNTNIFWVNANSLKEGIEEKVKKYNALKGVGTPLVIGVVADFYTGLDRDDLDNVLFGDEAVQIVYEKTTGNIVGQRLIRHANGLFEQTESALSAVLWVSREAGNWNAEAIHNSNASNRLPDTAFK
jgi:hypothetical protein